MTGLLALFSVGDFLNERKRILEDKTENLIARMEDLVGEISPTRVQRGRKRKLDDDVHLLQWKEEGQELVCKAKCLLSQLGGGRCRSHLMSAKMICDFDKLDHAFKVHEKEGDLILRRTLSDTRPCHKYHIPVNAVVGQVVLNTLRRLELLLQDDKVERIAIHGVKGVGKTFLMKHLYNSVLKWGDKFDHALWVTFPDQFTVKNLQDAVAAVLNCDLTSDDDLHVRAKKLKIKLAGFGNCVLFLDGVSVNDFCFDQIGIPVPAEGCKCKLVLTTSSSLGCRLLDCFERVKVDPLQEEDACKLFMREARIDSESASFLGDTPWLLANTCCGLPRMIVSLATNMRGIDDLHEWNHALFESRHKLEVRL